MAMIDSFGRKVTYLRLSVTDRCDLRCTYCMPQHMDFLPKRQVLTLEELLRVAHIFCGLGIRKIRLTGGEPLVRRDVLWLVQALGQVRGQGMLEELTLTTNGMRLEQMADDLAAAGVRRINVSVDSLQAETFRAVTRGGDLAQVQRGIDRARQAGLAVKINTVALKGVNDHEFGDLLIWCGQLGMDLCLIETMPLGDVPARLEHYLPLDQVREDLARNWTLQDTAYATGGPARYVTVQETGRRLGFISPLSHRFCEGCNRVRLTCTGTLYTCLGQEDAVDLRAALRDGPGDDAVRQTIVDAIAHKAQGHDFIIDADHRYPALGRTMSRTGG